jgi:molybdopterin molybdotransferase
VGFTAVAINRLGKPGVLVHGVNIRPGKPTILAVCKQGDSQIPKAVIGLPGNPVSALVIAQLFVIPVIRKLLGLTPTPLQPTLTARISTNLPSQTIQGTGFCQDKKIHEEFIAEPVLEKAI